MNVKEPRDFLLELQGAEGHSQAIPLDSVRTSLTEFGRVVDTLADYQRGGDIGSEPSAGEMPESRYMVTCRAIVPGSVGIAIGIQNSTPSSDSSTFAESLTSLVGQAVTLVDNEDLPGLETLIADSGCVRTVLRSFRKLNTLRKSVSVSIADAHGKTIYDGARKHRITLPRTTTRYALHDAIFNGRLRILNLGSGILKLDLLDGGSLELKFNNLSDLALNPTHWDRIVQICGNARRVENDPNVMIAELQSLTYIDESPIVMDRITLQGDAYSIDPPLVFTVAFNVDDQMYVLDGEYDIHLAEPTRAYLKIGIQELLETDWQHLVQEADKSRLTTEAMRRRESLQQRFKVVENNG